MYCRFLSDHSSSNINSALFYIRSDWTDGMTDAMIVLFFLYPLGPFHSASTGYAFQAESDADYEAWTGVMVVDDEIDQYSRQFFMV